MNSAGAMAMVDFSHFPSISTVTPNLGPAKLVWPCPYRLSVCRTVKIAPMPILRFLPEATKINFVGLRYIAFAIDGLLLLASIASIAIHGFNLGIDFTGGVLMEVKSERVIDIGSMR